MKTPFQLLDAFTLEDREKYFGRESEIEQGYADMNRTQLMLIYGLSGTGKTSLIQCGLASKYDKADWYPIFIRPGENVNLSLTSALKSALAREEEVVDVVDAVKQLVRTKYRPIHLIFDQFEEFFTLAGNTAEMQMKFMKSLRELLDADLRCHVIILMREEYIAQLYPFETIVPELFDFRFRIERMNLNKVRKVITQSFAKFNMHIEEPIEENLDLMVDNIAGGDGIIDLPYLQIYLDMLYQQDYADTYGEQGVDEKLPKLDITREEIEKLGRIDTVLSGFLDRRMRAHYVYLRKNYKGFPKRGVSHVLDQMATDKGTKKPISYKIENELLIPEFSDDLLEEVDKVALSELINRLSDDRIVRINPDTFELAHDSLAAIVAERRTDQDKQLQFQRRRILNAYDEFVAGGQASFLTNEQLIAFAPFLDKINLDKEHLSFIEKSREKVKFVVEEKRAQRQRELDERDAKIEAQKDAFVEKEKAEEARNEALEQGEIAIAEREKAEDALTLAQAARKKARMFQWLFVGLAIVVALSMGKSLWKNIQLVEEKSKLVEETTEELVVQTEKAELNKSISIRLEKEIEEIPKEIKRVDSQKRKNAAAPAFVVDGSFVAATKVSRGIAVNPKDTFHLNEQVWFLARIVVDKERMLYAQVYKGSEPVRGKNFDFKVFPNPIGYRIWKYVQMQATGEYRVELRTEIDGVKNVIYDYTFYVIAPTGEG